MKLLTDLHTHTYPSSHDGKNSLWEMVNSAAKKRIVFYGVSNHFDYDYDVSKMTPTELKILSNGDEDEYFGEARHLQQEYKHMLTFLVGAEFGFSQDKDVQQKYLNAYNKYKPDYVINSVHSYDGKDFCRSEIPADKKLAFGRYLSLVRESLDVPYHYDIVGHIEYIVRYVPFEEKSIDICEFQREIDDILKTIISKDKILEVNSSTYVLDRISLPSESILKRYFELGGRKVSFGSDAHSIDRLLDKRTKVIDMLKKIGFKYVTVPVRGEYIKVEI